MSSTRLDRVVAAIDALQKENADVLAARDELIADLRIRNTELVKKNDRLRRDAHKMRASNADMRKRLESLRMRFGRVAVDATPDDDIIPAGTGSYIAIAKQLEISAKDVRCIAGGIEPHHLSIAVIRRARTLLTNAERQDAS